MFTFFAFFLIRTLMAAATCGCTSIHINSLKIEICQEVLSCLAHLPTTHHSSQPTTHPVTLIVLFGALCVDSSFTFTRDFYYLLLLLVFYIQIAAASALNIVHL